MDAFVKNFSNTLSVDPPSRLNFELSADGNLSVYVRTRAPPSSGDVNCSSTLLTNHQNSNKHDNVSNTNGSQLSDYILHVEVCLKEHVPIAIEAVEKMIHNHLVSFSSSEYCRILGRTLKGLCTLINFEENEELKNIVEFIKIEDEAVNFEEPSASSSVTNDEISSTGLIHLQLSLHIFSMYCDTPGVEELSSVSGGGGDDSSTTSAAQIWMLPHTEFDSLWDSLFYKDDLKWRLVRYVETMLLFSDKNINQNIITYNRVVLLHGPPGTGKTSLCHSLAHRLSIRLCNRYRYCQFVEINSHSLFSRWFSESGKLVMAMFDKIRDLYSDPEALVFILIDEVESLAACRKSQGCEPSDAVRVVNAMLTQLDQLKCQPNVVVLTTSNLSGRVDLAFVDRADIKELVDLPAPYAAYSIIRSCIMELMNRDLISPKEPMCEVPLTEAALQSHEPSRRLFQMCCNNNSSSPVGDAVTDGVVNGLVSEKKKQLLPSLVGMSGRTLRKLPFLTIANCFDHSKVSPNGSLYVDISLNTFLEGFERTIVAYRKQMGTIERSS